MVGKWISKNVLRALGPGSVGPRVGVARGPVLLRLTGSRDVTVRTLRPCPLAVYVHVAVVGYVFARVFHTTAFRLLCGTVSHHTYASRYVVCCNTV